jgi:hypothetical protein
MSWMAISAAAYFFCALSAHINDHRGRSDQRTITAAADDQKRSRAFGGPSSNPRPEGSIGFETIAEFLAFVLIRFWESSQHSQFSDLTKARKLSDPWSDTDPAIFTGHDSLI